MAFVRQAPFSDVIPVMTRLSTPLDKVVDRCQYVVWRDRQALRTEEIGKHIRDGYKIWDLEFDGGPVAG